MANPMTAGLKPTHPGEMLRTIILPEIDRPKAEIARLLGISRQHFYDILNGEKPVTPNMALRLGKMFGGSPEAWIRMQNAFDLRREAEAMAEVLETIPDLAAA
ncbi:HigA family addiction module antitoxin [Rhizorhabdus histidinilytica]|uniref:Plasmid maintenance system antidote protein, XRE family n=1 Tax=Rhizorhabdus wittichii (strain DSM 6014 / CCUG 31198 / JCM 15750 / NBRC 105917 / EY 4224 / RW1) TaxID=392499 RepID=A0A9J9HBK9_RHIWR|nr:HigA family addiction module antitoxin [Sphingomonas sp. Y57]ABQ68543.1 putative plasmid maintenance system antidote protein, XRE family [Rhizorhabdus wittichii RW1]